MRVFALQSLFVLSAATIGAFGQSSSFSSSGSFSIHSHVTPSGVPHTSNSSFSFPVPSTTSNSSHSASGSSSSSASISFTHPSSASTTGSSTPPQLAPQLQAQHLLQAVHSRPNMLRLE
ncbi:hypothetical protein BDZ97DRAFT_1439373 [Flammula alnicola]|nr:hypothetical protein BDZ97DRAFT_1439373 [Flammula alnicola]